jgi:ABC-type sugar transport system substrate-binding protein
MTQIKRSLIAIAVAGLCGAGLTVASFGSAAASAGTPTTSAAQVAAAKAVVANLLKPAHTPKLAPLTKRPPAHKVIGYVTCSFPACEVALEDAAAAAKLLHWKMLPLFNAGVTPATFVAAVQQGLQAKPNYLGIASLFPNATIAKELQTASKQHTAIYEIAPSTQPYGPIFSVYAGPATFVDIGDHLADWVIAKSDGKGNVVEFSDPGITFLTEDKAFQKTLTTSCPGCTLDVQTYSQTTVGQAFPSQVVAYVQAHPSVQYLYVAESDSWVGVTAALRAAGLSSRVKMIAGWSGPADYAEIARDDPSYTTLAGDEAGGYYFVDAAARLSLGMKVPAQPYAQEQFLTPKTVGPWLKSGKQWGVPHLPATLAKLWHVSIPAGWKPGP